MLNLYTIQSYLTEENRKIVFPLLFDLCYLPNINLLEKYQIVSTIEDSDIAVVPVDIAHFGTNNKQGELDDFIFNAEALGKKVWLYSAGDYGKSLETSAYTFRMGGFDSKLNSQTFILPSFITDPYNNSQQRFQPISKAQLPQIGFVGNASNSLSKKIKEGILFLIYKYKRCTGRLYTDYQPFYPSSNKRFQFLTALQQSSKVKTDFIFRNKYRAGAKTKEEKEKTTEEFFKNIRQNPYTFCLRGAGNFSVRFYETLAIGRIPFIIDSDFRLPLSDNVNWDEHCVVAKKSDFIQTLSDFHEKISSDEFELMQINNRELWLRKLEREAYFTAIYSLFSIRKNEI